jgi:SAM-dependent methyltransferase
MSAGGLTQRRLEPEAMDDPRIDPGVHRAALEKLAQFNYIAGCAGTIAREIERLGGARERPLRVLDLATGGGDLPRRLMQRSQRDSRRWAVDGADISRTAVEHAREIAAGSPRALRPEYFVLDVLRDPLPDGYDVLTCSLFLHHLSVEDAVALLRKMKRAAKRAVIVQDMVRSHAGMRIAWLTTRLCSRNPVILGDATASVAAAFTLEEARDLARRAGFERAHVVNRWPCRWVLNERA